jgi:transcriptional regulator with XRE-family HTH domain
MGVDVQQVTCSVDDCDRAPGSRDMCGKHHRYWLAHTPKDQRPPIIKPKFWDFVDKDGPEVAGRSHLGRCWVWTGPANEKRGGYGRWRRALAHRHSWELANGPIPDGLWILHHCDNPPCVNPAHLYAGTHLDNMRDMAERGRAHVPAPATACPKGHLLVGRNLYEAPSKTPNGRRQRFCRTCANERKKAEQRAKRARAKAMLPPPPTGRITTVEAARRFGIPKATILEWHEIGRASAPVKYGKDYWWVESEIEHAATLYQPKNSAPSLTGEATPVDFYLLFGRGVAARRTELGLTQAAASRLLRSNGLTPYSRTEVAALECGQRFPPLAELEAVARVLDMSVIQLLPETERRVLVSDRLFGAARRTRLVEVAFYELPQLIAERMAS